ARALLLNYPRRRHSKLLVQIMYDYGVRKMFTAGFEGLQLRFYQLDALLKQHCPEVFSHFKRLGCEPHMYASPMVSNVVHFQVPLTAVNRVMDVVPIDRGRRRPGESGPQSESISTKRLDKLSKEFQAEQEAGKERTRDYRSDCMRLQEENDCLARELLHSQTQNRMQQDLLEDKLDVVQTELLLTKQMLTEKDDEALKLAENNARLKDMVRESSRLTATNGPELLTSINRLLVD
uniref:Rab-GAP TBC domain-containing protein n=1 Tax=Macrostomum lignano TaxID=282301 RepID=A0A1I8FMM2_9PLAT